MVTRKNILVILWVLVATILLLGANNSQASTNPSSFKASPEQLERLSSYDHLIEYFCAFEFFRPNHKISPDFIKALILAESNCKTTALSNKKAHGLTQILFSTGKEAAKTLSKSNITFRYVDTGTLASLKPTHLNDPAINILLACYLVSKYNHSYSGRLDLVIAAWNAGESTIKNNRPPAYKETLQLIKKVNSYFHYFLERRISLKKKKAYEYLAFIENC